MTELDINPGARQNRDEFDQAFGTFEAVYNEMAESVYMSDMDRLAVVALLGTGKHLLLQGSYGIGKTTIAKTLGEATSGSWSRIQGGPDVEASDITGGYTYNQADQSWSFHNGPIFNNVVLADELHRMPTKSQAGLVEAMEEGQVTTTRGETFELPKPQIVIATINKDGEEVAPVLLDRFGGSIDLPKQKAADRAKVANIKKVNRQTEAVASTEDVQQMIDVVKNKITMPDEIQEFANTLIDVVYEDPRVDHEESIEGGFRHFLNITEIAKFAALAQSKRTANTDHVAFAAPVVLQHRVAVKRAPARDGVTSRNIVEEAIAKHLAA